MEAYLIQTPSKLSTSSSSSKFISITLCKFPHSSLPFPSKTLLRFPLCCQSKRQPYSSTASDSALSSFFRAIPDWADGVKERGMKQKRVLYGHDNWVEHRSSTRHLRHLLNSLSSRVILSLVPPVIVCTFLAVVIASYNSAVSTHWLPEFFPTLRASSLPYQLTAPALALLLVFRTEASYSRFDEARKVWIRIISGANDLATQVIASSESPADEKLRRIILKYIAAFPVALKCHIIYGLDIAKDLQRVLESEDLAIVLQSKHRPRCIIEFIVQSLRMLDVEAPKLNVLESKLSCFHEGIETCEQLIGIPIPLSYTRLTSRILVLWHATLPIVLWDECHWIVVPATLISAAVLFGIEEVGVLIEEPFPMLALDEICQRFHRNLDEALRNDKMIREHLRNKFLHVHHRRSLNGRHSSPIRDSHD